MVKSNTVQPTTSQLEEVAMEASNLQKANQLLISTKYVNAAHSSFPGVGIRPGDLDKLEQLKLDTYRNNEAELKDLRQELSIFQFSESEQILQLKTEIESLKEQNIRTAENVKTEVAEFKRRLATADARILVLQARLRDAGYASASTTSPDIYASRIDHNPTQFASNPAKVRGTIPEDGCAESQLKHSPEAQRQLESPYLVSLSNICSDFHNTQTSEILDVGPPPKFQGHCLAELKNWNTAMVHYFNCHSKTCDSDLARLNFAFTRLGSGPTKLTTTADGITTKQTSLSELFQDLWMNYGDHDPYQTAINNFDKLEIARSGPDTISGKQAFAQFKVAFEQISRELSWSEREKVARLKSKLPRPLLRQFCGRVDVYDYPDYVRNVCLWFAHNDRVVPTK